MTRLTRSPAGRAAGCEPGDAPHPGFDHDGRAPHHGRPFHGTHLGTRNGRDLDLDRELGRVVGQSALVLQDDRPEDRQVISGIADLLVRHLDGTPESCLTGAYDDLLRELAAIPHSRLRNCGRLLLQLLMSRLTALEANARVLTRVTEAYFGCYDELARAQDRAQGAGAGADPSSSGGRRRRLLKMILAQPLVAADDIETLATALNWPVPTTVALAALAPRAEAPQHPPLGLPPEVLADFQRRDPLLLLPYPDLTAPRLEGLLHQWRMAIGPAVPFERAAVSRRRAGDLLGLLESGIVGGTDVARYDDHLATLLVFRDPELAESIVQLRLAPLTELDKATADRLAETLLTWIQHAGSVPATARRLHLHPQTVRYRMRQLHNLLGEALRDPRQRLELEAALRMWLSRPVATPR